MSLADAEPIVIDWRMKLDEQVMAMDRYRNHDRVINHAYDLSGVIYEEAEQLAELTARTKRPAAQVRVDVIEQRAQQLVDLVEVMTLRRRP